MSDRRRWVTRAALLATFVLLALVTLWVHLAEFAAELQWDSHIFMVIAKQMIQYGMLPYRDLWELKPPGVFYYLAGIFTVLPQARWSVRCVDFVVYLGAGLVYCRLCGREVGRPLAITGAAAWLFVAHHERFNMGGIYTEEYAAINAIVAVACAATYAVSGHARWALASGLGAAAAALFKHPGAAALVPSAVLITRRPTLRAYGLLLCGFVVPILFVIGYFWARGALEEFLECNFWALIVHGRFYQGVDQALVIQRLRDLVAAVRVELGPFPVLIAALAVGVPFALLRPSWLRVAALCWVIVDFIGVAAQRQYAQHHFILTFPSTCLIGTLAAGWLVEPRARDRWFLTLARAGMCGVVLWFALPALRVSWEQRLPLVRKNWQLLLSGTDAWPRSPARPQREEMLGRYLRDRTEPDDRIHVQGYTPWLLGIYWAADRRVATRYFYDAPYPLDPSRILPELRRNRPAYIVVAAYPPFQFIQPWLEADYSLEAVEWHEYRTDIWARVEPLSFAAGSTADLAVDAKLGGLVLPPMQSTDPDALVVGPPAPRRGQWTSPVVPVRSDDGHVFIDWNPRADLVWNRRNRGFPDATATFTGTDNDESAVLGAPTKRGYWTGWPRRDPQAVTIRFGLPVMLEQMELVPNDLHYADPAGCAEPVIQSTNNADGAASAFQLIDASWEVSMPYGIRTLRLPPRLATALRVVVIPQSCGGEGGVRRIRARAAGMGVAVRYRTGADAILDDQPWHAIDDNDEPQWVAAQRYVQVQYEVWSTYPKLTPVLRMAQIGRFRFELENPVAARTDGR